MFRCCQCQPATPPIPFDEIKAEKKQQDPNWSTDLSYDELLDSITKSFAGRTASNDGDGSTTAIGGEPVMMWCINHVKSSDEMKTRTELVKFMVSFYLNEMLTRNHLSLAKKNDKGEIVSTLVVTEYDPPQMESHLNELMKEWRQFVLGFKMAMEGKLPEICTSKDLKEEANIWKAKGDYFTNNLKPWHQKYGPPGRYIYVAFVAANPDYRGQGYGSELMKELNDIADSQGLALYLETGGKKNRAFYEKFGYRVAHHEVFKDPSPTVKDPDNNDNTSDNNDNGVDGFIMVRDAVQKSSGMD